MKRRRTRFRRAHHSSASGRPTHSNLNRFAIFLRRKHPSLAAAIAREIKTKTAALAGQRLLGRPIGGREEYRQLVLKVLNASYVFQRRVDRECIVILRVWHSREQRE